MKLDLNTEALFFQEQERLQGVAEPRDDLEKRFPLNDIQESFLSGRLLQSDQQGAGCHIYFEFAEPQIDPERLQRAWQQLIIRHDMLRTVIYKDANQQVKSVADCCYRVAVRDMHAQPIEEAALVILQTRDRLSHCYYDFGQWPLFSVEVSLLPKKIGIIHLSIDEWLLDGYSLTLLMQEWYLLYLQPETELSPLSYSFKDYVLAQKAAEKSAAFKQSLAYWHDFTIYPGPTLSTSHTALNGQGHKRYSRYIAAETWATAKLQAREERISPTALLLSLFCESLWQLSEQQAFSIILTLFNRQPLHSEVDLIIGPFVSTTFINYEGQEANLPNRLQAVQDQLWANLDHQRVSGIRILREKRGRGQLPASIPVVFTSTLNKAGSRTTDSWLEKMRYSISQTPQVSLDHQVLELKGELHLNFDVLESAISPAQMEALMNLYSQLLQQVAAKGISQIELPAAMGDVHRKVPQSSRLDTFVAATDTLLPLDPSKLLTTLQQSYVAASQLTGKGIICYQEFELDGLVIADLETAWNKQVKEQDMLRLVIDAYGRPQPQKEVPYYTIEAIQAPTEAALVELRAELEVNRFDFQQWPWFRIVHSTLPNGKERLHVCIDGLVGDGSSLQVLYANWFQEAIDKRLTQENTATLGYIRYRQAVTAFTDSEGGRQSLQYWEQKFINLDFERPVVLNKLTTAGQARRIAGRYARWGEIKQQCQQWGISPDALFSTLYHVLLNQLLQAEALPVVYVSWRKPETSLLQNHELGDYSRLCWQSSRLLEPSLAAQVQRVHEVIEQDLAQYPVDGLQVLQSLVLKGKLSIPNALVYTNIVAAEAAPLPDVVKIGYGLSSTPQVLVDCMSVEENGVLYYSWDYRSDLLDETVVKPLFDQYTSLLDQLIKQDWFTISMAEVLSQSVKPVVSSLASTSAYLQSVLPERLQGLCVHQWFEQVAAQHPHRIALTFGDKEYCYAELNRRANQLAHYLIARGAKSQGKIALYMNRSDHMLISLLAVLKTGSAYVPLDAQWPQERVQFVLDDCAPSQLLVDESALQLAFLSTPVELVDATLFHDLQETDTHNPQAMVSPADLVYIIYTSGSTGKPKGVLLSHYNLTRLFSSTAHWFEFDETDVWSFFHSYSFDFSAWEIWGAFFYGGRLLVIPHAMNRSFVRFYEYLEEQGVTVLSQTPTSFSQLITTEQELDRESRLKLRYVVFGGEALHYGSLRPWFERHEECSPQLINMYGITETTVHVTYRKVLKKDLDRENSPIGEPIPDLTLYIMDEQDNPVPDGQEGELYVGGPGLAQGYHQLPELTAARFVPDPYTDLPGAYLYKSGDIVKREFDGELIYIGRKDFQVKIRGFRIEIGEIEYTLAKHPDIQSVCVLIRDRESNDPKVVAYVMLAEPGSFRRKAVMQYLREKLPVYMVPNVFVPLAKLPLNLNGKVDRQALPWPPLSLAQGIYRLDQSELEILLMRELKSLVPAVQSELEADFFDLGLDSSGLVRLQQQISRVLQRTVSIDQLLLHTSVRELAAELASD